LKRIFAIPTVDGKSCAHFGHCEKFAVLEVDEGEITQEQYLAPPLHQPGVYPGWLAEAGVNIVISGGMGGMARDLFQRNNIEVHMGVGVEEPRSLVKKFLMDELETGANLCNHGDGDDDHHRCRD
jgi:predicted Fe-Mo cluster-binding NifX family protein